MLSYKIPQIGNLSHYSRKIHNYKCIGLEKSIKGKKTMTYRLMYNNTNELKSPTMSNTIVVDFDM